MKFTHRTDADVMVLAMSGQLTGGPDADQLSSRIRAAADSGLRLIILDLDEVSWVNSTGLGHLISSHLLMRQSGGSLRFIRVPRRIASILAVTRLSSVFEIFPTEEDARRAQPAAPSR